MSKLPDVSGKEPRTLSWPSKAEQEGRRGSLVRHLGKVQQSLGHREGGSTGIGKAQEDREKVGQGFGIEPLRQVRKSSGAGIA